MHNKNKHFLESKRLVFRPLNESDIRGEYSDWLNDPEVCEGNRHAIFPQSQMSLLKYIRNAEKSNDQILLAILLLSDKRHIGNISLQNIDFLNRSADLAILLGAKDLWGKGYGLEAVSVLINYGFERLGLRRITCGTLSNNLGMRKIAQKIGFHQEGIRREAVYKNKNFLDIFEYGIFQHEFKLAHKPK